ncbi:kelch-like protein 17 [Penaeus indicus]|uniref:kelch-like protein 17 n=1 Tax=Penaeus indicus TaxID=29960 RepID=UPI00300CC0B6
MEVPDGMLTAPRGHITGPRQYGLTLPGHRRTLSGPPLPPPASLPVLPDPTAHTMSVEVGTPGTPGTTPTQPLTHHFHATPDHATVALQAMNKLRMNSQLCDIELVAGAVSVFAHRVVLAAASAYFHVMFNSMYLRFSCCCYDRVRLIIIQA